MTSAILDVFGRPLKLSIAIEEDGAPSAPLAAPVVREDEVRDRALANPEVQRFQQVFEGSTVFKVRNLKE